ncbi:MAG: hypothetical protein J3R72DRAFT_526248 [Linnemannia gamsii]|nr:MAG: hypothetical protein J3R72DRAFT_526248 [Linnemannia gamsii]
MERLSNAFPVEMESSKTIGDLKKLIKTEKNPRFNDITADELTLSRVAIPDDDTDDETYILLDNLPRPPPVHAHIPAHVSTHLSGYFSDQSRPSTPLSEHAIYLNSYVQEKHTITLTPRGVRGLPKVFRQGVVESQDLKPNLLFLDLLDPPPSVSDPAPVKFRSNVLLRVLEEMHEQDLPVFGVCGCGKTRSMIELLCLQWGFYFNAAKSDFGSDDLFRLADLIDSKNLIDSKTSEDAAGTNTAFVKNMPLLLFLSRLMILGYCLKVPGCCQIFSSARCPLLLVYPNTFKDVFVHLCMELYDLTTARTAPVSDLASTIVRKEFQSVRESKVRVVIDEAQTLSDKSPRSHASSSTQGNLRPMLSPVLHAFRSVGIRDEMTIIIVGQD